MNILHIPKNTDAIQFFTENIDYPMAVYYYAGVPKKAREDVKKIVDNGTRAYTLAMFLAFLGIPSQVFPESYREWIKSMEI